MKFKIQKTQIALFALLLLVTATVKGQDSHMALNMGRSTPFGDFKALSDYSTDGYAKPGFVLSFDGNYIPTWYFGIGGALVFSSNFPVQDSMLSGLVTELEAVDGLPTFPEDVVTEFRIENWSCVNFLVGPTFAYPAGKFQFNLKALIGMSIILPPNQTLSLHYEDDVISAFSDEQDVSFCYTVGTDIIMKLGGNYSIKLGVEYFSTKTSHVVDIGFDEEYSLPSIQRDIDIKELHTTLGLAYLF